MGSEKSNFWRYCLEILVSLFFAALTPGLILVFCMGLSFFLRRTGEGMAWLTDSYWSVKTSLTYIVAWLFIWAWFHDRNKHENYF